MVRVNSKNGRTKHFFFSPFFSSLACFWMSRLDIKQCVCICVSAYVYVIRKKELCFFFFFFLHYEIASAPKGATQGVDPQRMQSVM